MSEVGWRKQVSRGVVSFYELVQFIYFKLQIASPRSRHSGPVNQLESSNFSFFCLTATLYPDIYAELRLLHDLLYVLKRVNHLFRRSRLEAIDLVTRLYNRVGSVLDSRIIRLERTLPAK